MRTDKKYVSTVGWVILQSGELTVPEGIPREPGQLLIRDIIMRTCKVPSSLVTSLVNEGKGKLEAGLCSQL